MSTPPDEIRVVERPPLIVVEFSGFPDDDEFRSYLKRVEALLEARAARPSGFSERNAILYDTSDSTRPVTASQRKMQADHMRLIKQGYASSGGEAQAAVAFVIKNMLVRGVLTAILWLQPMRERYKVFAERTDAEAWCRSWIVGTLVEGDDPDVPA